MVDLRNAIMATLAYYDIFDYPLTLVEVYRYLINPVRLERKLAAVPEIALADVDRELVRLAGADKIGSRNGFFALSAKRISELYDLRMERQKIASAKYKKLLSCARWFQAVPYLRGMMVSGSLALHNSGPNGDFDVLVVTKAGRLYTCRVLLSLVASLMGMRRTRHDLQAPDKFCFNHYLTDDSLTLEHIGMYTAHTYAQLVPVLIRDLVDERFFSANLWLNQFLYNFKPTVYSERQYVRPDRILDGIARVGEAVLSSALGEWIEGYLKRYQQRRISDNPVTREPGGRIIFTESHLEFHPRSFESVVILRYNEALQRFMAFPPKPEVDSGLKSS